MCTMEKKRLTSIRLSPAGKRLLEVLATQLGISQAAVLEVSIREHARRWASRNKEGSMSSVRGALMNLASSLTAFRDAGGTLCTEAGIVSDMMVNDPEWAHLAPLVEPLAEQLREIILVSFTQCLDAIPPALGEAMENATEFAGEF
jgi:hypothetical protein